MKKIFLMLVLTTLSVAQAQDLTINGAEFGIGKFHRKDNKVHKYEANNAWSPFILPEGADTKTALVRQNSASNYTIFFTNLEEFLTKIVELSTKTGKKVAILNLNAHGLPGGMWFPVNAKTRDAAECASWRTAASNSDDSNYTQYYSAVPKDEILQLTQMSNSSRIPSYQCLTGLNEWTAMVAKVPAIKSAFTDNAQVHMLSCIVGLGTLGDAYTQGLAKVLFAKGSSQQVQTSIKFGLGDWSMPEGMGFWGLETDAQLDRDNSVYPIHRRDSEIMQKGSIRVAQVSSNKVQSGLIKLETYMLLEHDDRVVDYSAKRSMPNKMDIPLPQSIRVPGTKIFLKLK